jgi:hypothetical protein
MGLFNDVGGAVVEAGNAVSSIDGVFSKTSNLLLGDTRGFVSYSEDFSTFARVRLPPAIVAGLLGYRYAVHRADKVLAAAKLKSVKEISEDNDVKFKNWLLV